MDERFLCMVSFLVKKMIKKILKKMFGSPERVGTLLAYNMEWFTESTWAQRIERNGQLYRYSAR